MNFQIGGECLCIKSHSGVGGKVAYIKGHKYPILGLKQGCSHTPLLIDIGETFFDVTYCSECNDETVGNYFHAANFVPIDNTLSDTTVEELLEEPLTQH